MHVYLGPNISQAFWRVVYPCDRKPGVSLGTPAPIPQPCAGSMAAVEAVPLPWIARYAADAGGVDLIVFDRQQRRCSRECKTRLWNGSIAPGSFCQLREDVSVASPAFTFLLMARGLSLHELIAYGDELCGTYAFDDSSPRGMRQRQQGAALTSRAEIARFLESVEGAGGVKKARRALQFVVDGSASPMETLDEMLFCLPYRYGGYGLSKPVMNPEIRLSPAASLVAMRKTCRADLLWPELKLVIEHQGWHDHGGRQAFSSDRARMNGLKTDGYEVIELTKDIVDNLPMFEEIACRIAKLQGKRIEAQVLGATEGRLLLRKALNAWNARGGRCG